MIRRTRAYLNSLLSSPHFNDPIFIIQSLLATLLTYGMKILGPALIAFACAIVSGLVYVDFTLVLPLLYQPEPKMEGNGRSSSSSSSSSSSGLPPIGYVIHTLIAIFLLTNVLFNYYCCVMAR